MTWVKGSALATSVSAAGNAPMGNSAPAKNHGRTASAGVVATYSSWRGMRLASVSAIAYMRTVSATAAATNHATPAALASNVAPRTTATATSTPTCSAARPSTTTAFATTSSARGIGAARSSRWAPLSRSTITLSPANTAVNGTSSPTVPTDTYAV